MNEIKVTVLSLNDFTDDQKSNMKLCDPFVNINMQMYNHDLAMVRLKLCIVFCVKNSIIAESISSLGYSSK